MPTPAIDPGLPDDVSRSGYIHPNLCLLVEPCGLETLLELALIHCDMLGAAALERFHLGGRVDALRRVEIVSGDGTTLIRCARLAHRTLESALEDDNRDGHYYSRRWAVW